MHDRDDNLQGFVFSPQFPIIELDNDLIRYKLLKVYDYSLYFYNSEVKTLKVYNLKTQ